MMQTMHSHARAWEREESLPEVLQTNLPSIEKIEKELQGGGHE